MPKNKNRKAKLYVESLLQVGIGERSSEVRGRSKTACKKPPADSADKRRLELVNGVQALGFSGWW